MVKQFFITGTDTNIGKTYITIGLLNRVKQLNIKAIGLKPIATGCYSHNNKLYNADALLLQQHSTIPLQYDQINPFALAMATAPNIAAASQNLALTQNIITTKLAMLCAMSVDLILLEGLGGWHVPLNSQETMADVVKAMACPVILVVGLKLGCINHAILTYNSIIETEIQCAGWISNCVDPAMEYIEHNISTLKAFIHAPYLGTVQYNAKPEDVLDVSLLL